MTWHVVFSGLQSPWWVAFTVIATLLCFTACVSLLRAEWKLVSRPVGVLLLCVRLATMALLLFILLQPGLLRSIQDEDLPELIIAVDVSGSMQSCDRHADADELIVWAQALDIIPRDLEVNELEEWRQAWTTAKSEPASTIEGVPHTVDAAQYRWLLLDDMSRLSRVQLAQRLLQRAPSSLFEKLGDEQDLRVVLFDSQHHNVPTDDSLEEILAESGSASVTTDIAGVLNYVLTTEVRASGRSVLLLSDGRQTVPGNAVDAAHSLGNQRIPIYTVAVGSQQRPKDLIAQPVDAPGSIFANDAVEVSSTIAAAGYNGRAVTVRLREGDEILKQREVKIRDDEARARFLLPNLSDGHHDLTVDVEVLPGELSDENNEQDFSIAVIDANSTVMLIEENPRWEFRYLHNLLERDSSVELHSTLFRQPFLNLLDESAMSTRLPDRGFLRSVLSDTDLLILGDLPSDRLSGDVWMEITQAVESGGMTMVMIPGRFVTDLTRFHVSLQKLLPMTTLTGHRAEDVVPSGDGRMTAFRLRPRPEAMRIPMFQLQPDAADNAATISRLPGHPWIAVGTPRPAASVWADAVIQTSEGEESFPLVVQHHYGSGQVIWMGIDSTWRWRRRSGDRWHHRFWGQLVRWAARNRSFSGTDDVRLTVMSEYISEQQSVDVAVALSEAAQARLADTHVQLEIYSGDLNSGERDEPTTTVVLSPAGDDSLRYQGEVAGLSAGRYLIRVGPESLMPVDAKPVQSPLTVVERASPELSDIRADHQHLQQIADVSGGRLLAPYELTELPDILRNHNSRRASRPEAISLWDHWSVLVVLFSLMLFQWIVRKLSGLP